jgi:ADP-ribose pyrophosphatase YjhB (NUDIX family)
MVCFNFLLGIQNVDKKKNIISRKAVRAVILKNDNILMVHNNKGDYKFPGGGININEKPEEALEREVKEETGNIIKNIVRKLGEVIERKVDKNDINSIFEHISYYYLCEVADEHESQQLDDYEAELDFYPIWIDLDRAIEQNECLLHDETIEKNHWVNRETAVLKALKECNGIW